MVLEKVGIYYIEDMLRILNISLIGNKSAWPKWPSIPGSKLRLTAVRNLQLGFSLAGYSGIPCSSHQCHRLNHARFAHMVSEHMDPEIGTEVGNKSCVKICEKNWVTGSCMAGLYLIHSIDPLVFWYQICTCSITHKTVLYSLASHAFGTL